MQPHSKETVPGIKADDVENLICFVIFTLPTCSTATEQHDNIKVQPRVLYNLVSCLILLLKKCTGRNINRASKTMINVQFFLLDKAPDYTKLYLVHIFFVKLMFLKF